MSAKAASGITKFKVIYKKLMTPAVKILPIYKPNNSSEQTIKMIETM